MAQNSETWKTLLTTAIAYNICYKNLLNYLDQYDWLTKYKTVPMVLWCHCWISFNQFHQVQLLRNSPYKNFKQ